MYGWLWRTLPGGRVGKTLWAAALAAGAIVLLFLVVFPYAETLLPYQDVTVRPAP